MSSSVKLGYERRYLFYSLGAETYEHANTTSPLSVRFMNLLGKKRTVLLAGTISYRWSFFRQH